MNFRHHRCRCRSLNCSEEHARSGLLMTTTTKMERREGHSNSIAGSTTTTTQITQTDPEKMTKMTSGCQLPLRLRRHC
jgi:hypothetical protein